MIPLQTHAKPATLFSGPVLGRLAFEPVAHILRPDHVLVGASIIGADLAGYAGALVKEPAPADSYPCPVLHSARSLDHLASGDVVALHPNGYVRTLFRAASKQNSLFATDNCNSLCLMCSQPPREVDDSGRVGELLRLIHLLPPETQDLGITGGEPTLLKDGLLEIIAACKEQLPETAIHVLSNGRLFYYGSYARKLAAVGHPKLVIGVPVYSDIDYLHDHVVQSQGAFEDTIVGLQNLGRFGVPVEIRIVIHKLTVERLRETAKFIYRNFSFAAHVAFMGLEMIGFAVPNRADLWVDPVDYQKELRQAVLFLANRGMNVSIYNHQLCILPQELWAFSRQAISDWKNEYLPVCSECTVQSDCGGFFANSVGRQATSRGIAAFGLRQ